MYCDGYDSKLQEADKTMHQLKMLIDAAKDKDAEKMEMRQVQIYYEQLHIAVAKTRLIIMLADFSFTHSAENLLDRLTTAMGTATDPVNSSEPLATTQKVPSLSIVVDSQQLPEISIPSSAAPVKSMTTDGKKSSSKHLKRKHRDTEKQATANKGEQTNQNKEDNLGNFSSSGSSSLNKASVTICKRIKHTKHHHQSKHGNTPENETKTHESENVSTNTKDLLQRPSLIVKIPKNLASNIILKKSVGKTQDGQKHGDVQMKLNLTENIISAKKNYPQEKSSETYFETVKSSKKGSCRLTDLIPKLATDHAVDIQQVQEKCKQVMRESGVCRRLPMEQGPDETEVANRTQKNAVATACNDFFDKMYLQEESNSDLDYLYQRVMQEKQLNDRQMSMEGEKRGGDSLFYADMETLVFCFKCGHAGEHVCVKPSMTP